MWGANFLSWSCCFKLLKSLLDDQRTCHREAEVKSHLSELPLLQAQQPFCAKHLDSEQRHKICLLFLASAECRDHHCYLMAEMEEREG